MLYCCRGDNMPRQKSGNFDQGQYINEYIQQKILYRRMNFNLQRRADKKMVAWIDMQEEGVSNYLKSLVEYDMYENELTTAGKERLKQAEIIAETDPKYQPKEKMLQPKR